MTFSRSLRRSRGVRAVGLALSVIAGIAGSGACATPPENDLIGGLPCDHGACANGFVCDGTGKCVAPNHLRGDGGLDGGGNTGSGGRVPETGGAPTGGASENGGSAETGGAASGGAGGTLGAGGGGRATGGGGSGGSVLGGSGGHAPGTGGDASGGSGSGGAPPVGCTDGTANGTETSVDCGGPTCDGCPPGASCDIDLDCASHQCDPHDAGRGACLAPACNDGIVNGLETGADCGGGCPPCADGGTCRLNTDCASKHCLFGTCAAPTCLNGQKDGTESDTDCGGPSCPLCLRGAICKVGSDCTSGVCKALSGPGSKICALPTCSDTVKNGTESDKDCGGAACSPCAAGKLCGQDSDCESGSCARVYSLMVCQP
jgi:hypothetical protein